MTHVIFENDYFQIKPGDGCTIPGYLIIFAKIQAASVDQLSFEAQTGLGQTIALAHRAINEMMQPQRIYTLSLGELLHQVHFHIFPRTAEMLTHYRQQNHLSSGVSVDGALLFSWARQYYQQQETECEVALSNIKALFKQFANLR